METWQVRIVLQREERLDNMNLHWHEIGTVTLKSSIYSPLHKHCIKSLKEFKRMRPDLLQLELAVNPGSSLSNQLWPLNHLT